MAPEEGSPSLLRELLFDRGGGGGDKGGSEPMTEEERKRRRRKVAALLAILAALVVILIMILRSLGGSSPLPGIPSDVPSHESNIYGVQEPMGVAVSPDGDRVYVTESEGPRLVRVFDGSGDKVGALKPPGHKGAWRLPVYVAVDPNTEDVYVSDRLREDVDVYSPDGKYLRAFKPTGPLGKDANPLGLAFDDEGHLYMTDVRGEKKEHRVLVFDTDSEKPLRRIGKPGDFWFPNGIVVDGDGNVYVADSNNGRVQIFDSEGKLAGSIARGVGEGDLGLPRGVAIDGDRLLVADTTAHTVKVYDRPGDVSEVPRYLGSFGVEGVGDDQFQYPNGIAVGNGKIYVTDRENDRVQIWSY
jgi:DNA-binding beta-propeller fold protein YncE